MTKKAKNFVQNYADFFMTNGPIMGHDVIVIGTKVR